MSVITISGMNEAQIDGAIRSRASFEVIGLRGAFRTSILAIEKKIEAQGLKCRVSSDVKGTLAQAGAVGVLAGLASFAALPVAALTAAGLTAHKLATLNPDYEIVKDYVQMKLTVRYMRSK
jgi:hypothetical protein